MKRKYIVSVGLLFLGFIVVLLFIFNKNEVIKDNTIQKSGTLNIKRGPLFVIVNNQPRLIKVFKYSKVINRGLDEVRFDVPGELIIGETELCNGCFFKQDQLLFRINNKDKLTDLIQAKKLLYNSIFELLPKIKVSHPKEINKWNDYINSITPTKLLSVLPFFSSDSEKELFNTNRVLKFYSDVILSEKQMEKYFYLAPYDGFFIKSYISETKNIKPTDLVATISKSKDLIIRFSISKNEFDNTLNNISFYDEANKKEIGKCILKEHKENHKTNYIDVYYLIDKKLNNKILLGSKVAVEFNSMQNCCILPFSLIRKGIVKVLEGKKIKFKKVDVLGSKSKSLIVKGLSNGEKVVF